jgi:intraflagellar transport protein 88
MMQNVHLAPETDEDDLYSGCNDYNPTFATEIENLVLFMLEFC